MTSCSGSRGSGAYEGWSYVAVLTDYDRAGTDVRGVPYRGDLPPSVAQDLVTFAVVANEGCGGMDQGLVVGVQQGDQRAFEA